MSVFYTMNFIGRCTIGLLAGLICIVLTSCGEKTYDFRELDSFLKLNNTDAILISLNGKVVHENYFSGFEKTATHDGYSLAKSFTNAAIGIAIYEGEIQSIDTDVFTVLPEYTELNDRGITIRHLLSMQSGIEFLNQEHYPVMMKSSDSVNYMLDLPIEEKSGELWRYKADPTLLSSVITHLSKQTMHEYMDERLFDALGMDVKWTSDASGLTNGNGDISMSTHDYAKFGKLFLNEGIWNGKRLFAQTWVESSTAPCNSPERRETNVWTNEPQIVAGNTPLEYGHLWWCRLLPGFPKDSFYAFGSYGQFIIVVPSENLVVVRLGSGPGHSDLNFLPEFTALISNALQLETK